MLDAFFFEAIISLVKSCQLQRGGSANQQQPNFSRVIYLTSATFTIVNVDRDLGAKGQLKQIPSHH